MLTLELSGKVEIKEDVDKLVDFFYHNKGAYTCVMCREMENKGIKYNNFANKTYSRDELLKHIAKNHPNGKEPEC